MSVLSPLPFVPETVEAARRRLTLALTRRWDMRLLPLGELPTVVARVDGMTVVEGDGMGGGDRPGLYREHVMDLELIGGTCRLVLSREWVTAPGGDLGPRHWIHAAGEIVIPDEDHARIPLIVYLGFLERMVGRVAGGRLGEPYHVTLRRGGLPHLYYECPRMIAGVRMVSP